MCLNLCGDECIGKMNVKLDDSCRGINNMMAYMGVAVEEER